MPTIRSISQQSASTKRLTIIGAVRKLNGRQFSTQYLSTYKNNNNNKFIPVLARYIGPCRANYLCLRRGKTIQQKPFGGKNLPLSQGMHLPQCHWVVVQSFGPFEGSTAPCSYQALPQYPSSLSASFSISRARLNWPRRPCSITYFVTVFMFPLESSVLKFVVLAYSIIWFLVSAYSKQYISICLRFYLQYLHVYTSKQCPRTFLLYKYARSLICLVLSRVAIILYTLKRLEQILCQ